MSRVTILNPKVVTDDATITNAARLNALSDMRIGFVDNSKLNADIFIERVSGALKDKYGVEIGEVVRKLAPKDALNDDEVNRLTKYNAVVQCFGDCGTSTSMTVADAVTLEAKGIPTATVFSTAFSGAARQQAVGRGLAHLPLVEIPHPMHTATQDAILERADAVVEQIAKTLSDSALIKNDKTSADSDAAIEIDSDSLNDAENQELFFERGWTDGLPIVPPTLEKVQAMLAATKRTPHEEVGAIPPRMRMATVEKIAINAVMAGCKPAYFPVVLAAVEAMLDKDCDLYGAQTATNMSTPLLILNGPIVEEINANSGRNCFGPGNRANATIGRAVRLVCWNVGGEIPEETDMATHGQPGKFTFCFAEAESENPWGAFHVEKGFKANESTVTVLGGASSPHNVFTYGCENGREVIDHFVGAMTALGNNNIIFPSGPLLVFSPEHAQVLARDGFTKEKIRDYIFKHARIPLSRFGPRSVKGLHHRRSNWFATVGDPDHIGVADKPEDIQIVVAGGPGIHSLFIPTSFSHRPVVRKIEKN
ncbi:MAG: hypothetical protein RIB59_07535 [Rhodospirillales bacterium]